MSAELPDDVHNWPEDPFALLGVERGADDDTIRRAYTRLIRRFKPERAPEQFQKIRDAFESCQMQASWFRPDDPFADEPASELPAWTPQQDLPPDEVEKLWTLAVEGNLASAYAGLAQQARASERVDLPLRLYWLLTLEPDLDDSRTRHHWLALALKQSQLGGAALELYRRELEADAPAALNEPYEDLIAGRGESVLTFTRLRINAAGKAGRFSFIEHDLKQAKRCLGIDGDLDWLGLITCAHDWAAWDQPAPLMVYLAAELHQLRHLELNNSYFFDRIEEGDRWSQEQLAIKRSGLPEGFVQLVANTWANYSAVTRGEMLAATEPMLTVPSRYLARLDDLIQARGNGFAVLATMALERLQRPLEPDYPADLLRALARRGVLRWKEYDFKQRQELLKVLLAEGVHPQEFSDACAADPEARYRRLASQIAGDLSLRILWLAENLHGHQPA